MQEWFRTDIGPHFLDCLTFSERQLGLVGSNIREWPWTILGLAGTVQAACALYLDERDTMSVAVLSDQCRKGTIEALQFESGKKSPRPYMAPPKTLLKRVQDDCGDFDFSDQDKKDLEYLLEFRNEFTHLTPKGWSIQTVGLPRIAASSINLVEIILRNPGLYERISNDERDRSLLRCKAALRKCRALQVIT